MPSRRAYPPRWPTKNMPKGFRPVTVDTIVDTIGRETHANGRTTSQHQVERVPFPLYSTPNATPPNTPQGT